MSNPARAPTICRRQRGEILAHSHGKQFCRASLPLQRNSNAIHSAAGICGGMRRISWLIAVRVLVITIASAQHGMVETQVEAKKAQLLQFNAFARSNPELLREKVFCLCSVCSVLPIMTRNLVTGKGTAYAHRQMDVQKGLITKAELKAANGTKTFVSYWDYFRLYRRYAAGQVDEHGIACDIQMDSATDTYEPGMQSYSADQSQCCPHVACTLQYNGMCLSTLQRCHQVYTITICDQ